VAERIVYALNCWRDGGSPENVIAGSDAGVIRQAYLCSAGAMNYREASLAAQIEFVASVLEGALSERPCVP